MKKQHLRTVLLVLAVVLGVSACRPVYTGPEGAKVAVVGDSITNGSSDALDAALADQHRFVSGVDGIDLADGRNKLIQPVVESEPEVLVVELGINSAREVWNSTDLAHLESVLAAVKPVPCVIWVTPNALPTSYYDHLGDGTINARIALFQASLHKRLPKHPNVHLADFGAIQVEHPEWYQDDHLHPNEAGRVAYADYVATQIADQC